MLTVFCARFALVKTGLSNQNLTQEVLKLRHLCKKRKNIFADFFLRPPNGVTNFNTSPIAPPVLKISYWMH